ncbi:MAG: YdcF family protein [Cyanobacteriota bacterium]|nr:YdcF family protein [Cyanobacteriota bacterium]
MFLLLTRVLLWLLIGYIIYFVLIAWLTDKWRAIIGTILIWFTLTVGFYDPTFVGMSYLWEILAFFLKPLGLAIILVYVGLQKLLDDKAKKLGRKLIVSGLVVLLVASNPYLTYKAAQRTEYEWIRLDQVRSELSPTVSKNAAAIVLIGQKTTDSGVLDSNPRYDPAELRNFTSGSRIELGEAGDRILYTAALYRQQKRTAFAPLVIVAAAPRENLTSREIPVEAEKIAVLLERLGVASGDIILETEGKTLHNIGRNVKDILSDLNIENRPVIAVNSALHMRRTSTAFMNVGINVISKPTDFYTAQPPSAPNRRIAITDFIPSAEALALMSKTVEEYLGLIYYFLRGWGEPTVV